MNKDEIKRVKKKIFRSYYRGESLLEPTIQNNKRETEGRAQFYQKTQRNAIAITIASSFQTLVEGHPRYGDLMWGYIIEKKSVQCKRYKIGHSTQILIGCWRGPLFGNPQANLANSQSRIVHYATEQGILRN